MGYDTNLEKLAELKDGWNGRGSAKPSAAALATARWITAVPTGDGGIQIEMAAGEAEIEIIIRPDGRVVGASFYKSE